MTLIMTLGSHTFAGNVTFFHFLKLDVNTGFVMYHIQSIQFSSNSVTYPGFYTWGGEEGQEQNEGRQYLHINIHFRSCIVRIRNIIDS